MSGMFGGDARKARAMASKQAADARRDKQASTTEAAREQQQAERGASRGGRGRDMLMGQLSTQLKGTLGG